MTSTITMTGRQLERVLIPLIDLATDPLAPIERTSKWLQAQSALKAILSNPANYRRIFEVQTGKASTRPLFVIGQRRADWLRRFYEDEVDNKPPSTRGE